MDYHSLTRRELQTLCKKNKIPANITNVAMADALKALQFVSFLSPDSCFVCCSFGNRYLFIILWIGSSRFWFNICSFFNVSNAICRWKGLMNSWIPQNLLPVYRRLNLLRKWKWHRLVFLAQGVELLVGRQLKMRLKILRHWRGLGDQPENRLKLLLRLITGRLQCLRFAAKWILN